MFVVRIKSEFRAKFIKYLKKTMLILLYIGKLDIDSIFFKNAKSKDLSVTNKIVREILSLPFIQDYQITKNSKS